MITNEQRKILKKAYDSRSGFEFKMKIDQFWNLVWNNGWHVVEINATSSSGRSVECIKFTQKNVTIRFKEDTSKLTVMVA